MNKELKESRFKIYKSNNKIINEMLKANNIIIVIDTKNNFKGYISAKRKYYNRNYRIIITVKREITLNNILSLINHYTKKTYSKSIDDQIFTDIRSNLDFNSVIIGMFNMKFHHLTTIEKTRYILFNYYDIKELIDKYGIKKFRHYYKETCVNHYINYLYKHINISIEDYFRINHFRYMIQLYKEEIDNTVELKSPKLTNGMILKYINNYFSKCVLISYDRRKIRNYISNYYITSSQIEDNIIPFIHKIIYLYQEVNDLNFRYDIVYKYEYNKSSYLNHLVKFFLKIDSNIIENELLKIDNYKIIMFLFELIEVQNYRSHKKQIVDYIAALELILVHDSSNADNTISQQFVYKIKEIIKNNNLHGFDKKELYLMYAYRSKVIHGDYLGMEKILMNIKKLSPYNLNKKKYHDETYLTAIQLTEEIMLQRIHVIFQNVILTFFKNNNYIKELKNKKVSQLKKQ